MLQIKNLVKNFGKLNALDGFSMDIEQGQLYGFVGPNGAGKTTTMKIVAGLLAADSGSITIDGINALENPSLVADKIGYMPDFFGVYDNLTTMEYMEFFAAAYKLPTKQVRIRIEELLELVNLEDKKNAYVDTLSRGMKQRLCLARTMIHCPKLLILDEPASGLEPRARLELQGILRDLCSKQVTILLSSHILNDLADVCTHIGIIERGKMVVQGDVKSIIAKQKSENPILLKILSGQETAMTYLKEHPLVSNLASENGRLSFGFAGSELEEAQLLKGLLQLDVAVASFYRNEGNLEEVFLRLTQ